MAEVRRRHQHDCEECLFLGTYFYKYDVYTCKQKTVLQTFIARYGNDGPQYVSIPEMVIEQMTVKSFYQDDSLKAILRGYLEYTLM